MDIKDFTPSQSEANRLSAIDELVDLGMSRAKAEELVGQFNNWLDTHFSPALEAVKAMSNPYDRAFLQSSIVVFLCKWSVRRVDLADIAQQLAMQAIIDQEKSNG